MPNPNSPNRRVVSPQEARDQAAEFFGFAASKEIKLSDQSTVEIPNPGVMDDEQQARFEELQVSLDDYDHEEVEVPIFETETVTDPDGTIHTYNRPTGKTKTERQLKTPHRKGGELVKPPYNVRLAKALFGEEGYERYRAGGGIANQIALEWARMDREFRARMDADPK